MTQTYGQHNSHHDWVRIKYGLSTNNSHANRPKSQGIKDINDDEAILVDK